MRLLIIILLLIPSTCFAVSYSITNGNLLTVNSNGNLGIGSLNPGQALDIIGTIRMNGFSMPNNASSGYVLTSDNLGNGSWSVSTGNPAGTDTQIQYNQNGKFGATSQLSFDRTNYILQVGQPNGLFTNLSGVQNANGELTVAGHPLVMKGLFPGDAIYIANGQGANVSLDVFYGNITLDNTAECISNALCGNINLSTTQSVVMGDVNGIGHSTTETINDTTKTINFVGNVGISSVNPGQALDVFGTVRMQYFNMPTSSSSGYVLTSDNAGNGTWKASTGGSGANYWINSSGNVGINTTFNVGIGTTTELNNLDVKGTVMMGTYAGQYTGNPNGLAVSGNIGMGTYNPQFALSVKDSGSTYPVNIGQSKNFSGYNQVMLNGNQSSLYQIGIVGGSTDNNLYLFSSAVSNNGQIVFRPNGNTTYDSFNPGGSLAVGQATAPSNMLTVNGAGNFVGNVGIGSVTPGQALDVKGTIRSSVISGQSSGTMLCAKGDGSIGYCSGSITGVVCGTCN